VLAEALGCWAVCVGANWEATGDGCVEGESGKRSREVREKHGLFECSPSRLTSAAAHGDIIDTIEMSCRCHIGSYGGLAAWSANVEGKDGIDRMVESWYN
jgi:hypothetical protein